MIIRFYSFDFIFFIRSHESAIILAERRNVCASRHVEFLPMALLIAYLQRSTILFKSASAWTQNDAI